MKIIKRLFGVLLVLIAARFFAVSGNYDGSGHLQSIWDSPEASGHMLSAMMPVVLFGAVGLWCLFSSEKVA